MKIVTKVIGEKKNISSWAGLFESRLTLTQG